MSFVAVLPLRYGIAQQLEMEILPLSVVPVASLSIFLTVFSFPHPAV